MTAEKVHIKFLILGKEWETKKETNTIVWLVENITGGGGVLKHMLMIATILGAPHKGYLVHAKSNQVKVLRELS